MNRTKPLRRPIVLAVVAHYPPAYLAGGPTRSVPALVRGLGDSLDFRVVTSDHDLGGRSRLDGIVANRWTQHKRASVLYLSRTGFPIRLMMNLARVNHEVLYLNSVFSIAFTFLPLLFRRLGVLPRRQLVIAPRGELSDGALQIKRRRKRFYLFLLWRIGLLHNPTWHAASRHEGDDIRRAMGSVRVVVAPNIPTAVEARRSVSKEPGALRIVYLARIAKKKNLLGAIGMLRGLRGSIRLDIYGPVEDPEYWAEVRAQSRELSDNVTFQYCGVVPPSEVGSVLASYDLFLLPTLGENYGHAIVEALSVGCPVLLSDRTPWRDLEAQRAGWDLPLGDHEAFRSVLQACVDMSARGYSVWSEGARKLGDSIQNDATVLASYGRLFPIRSPDFQRVASESEASS